MVHKLVLAIDLVFSGVYIRIRNEPGRNNNRVPVYRSDRPVR